MHKNCFSFEVIFIKTRVGGIFISLNSKNCKSCDNRALLIPPEITNVLIINNTFVLNSYQVFIEYRKSRIMGRVIRAQLFCINCQRKTFISVLFSMKTLKINPPKLQHSPDIISVNPTKPEWVSSSKVILFHANTYWKIKVWSSKRQKFGDTRK